MNYQFQTENPKTLRACVFIDSSNPSLPNQIMNHSSHPFIKPPFPPLIDPKDLLIIGKNNKPSRSPNAFIIYRKVFFKTTRDQGYFLPMTIISSMASKSWDQEPDEVKSHYKILAKEAYKYRTERFPKKIKRRRKKEPWNVDAAFQNDLYNSFYDDVRSKKFPHNIPSQGSSQNSSPSLEPYESDFQPNNNTNDLSPNTNSVMVNDVLNNRSDQPYLFDPSNTEFNLPINSVDDDQNLTDLRCQENDFPNQIDFNNDLNMLYNHFDISEFTTTTDLLNSIPYQNVLGISLNSTTEFGYENFFQS